MNESVSPQTLDAYLQRLLWEKDVTNSEGLAADIFRLKVKYRIVVALFVLLSFFLSFFLFFFFLFFFFLHFFGVVVQFKCSVCWSLICSRLGHSLVWSLGLVIPTCSNPCACTHICPRVQWLRITDYCHHPPSFHLKRLLWRRKKERKRIRPKGQTYRVRWRERDMQRFG